MSAPQTNIEKQKRRHRGPLVGMIVVVIAVGLGYLWWVGYEVAESNPPQGSQTQIDGRTGEQVPPDGSVTGTTTGTTPETVAPPAQPSQQSSPGVPVQNVDPLTPADVPAVDPVPESAPAN